MSNYSQWWKNRYISFRRLSDIWNILLMISFLVDAFYMCVSIIATFFTLVYTIVCVFVYSIDIFYATKNIWKGLFWFVSFQLEWMMVNVIRHLIYFPQKINLRIYWKWCFPFYLAQNRIKSLCSNWNYLLTRNWTFPKVDSDSRTLEHKGTIIRIHSNINDHSKLKGVRVVWISGCLSNVARYA